MELCSLLGFNLLQHCHLRPCVTLSNTNVMHVVYIAAVVSLYSLLSNRTSTHCKKNKWISFQPEQLELLKVMPVTSYSREGWRSLRPKIWQWHILNGSKHLAWLHVFLWLVLQALIKVVLYWMSQHLRPWQVLSLWQEDIEICQRWRLEAPEQHNLLGRFWLYLKPHLFH